VGTVLLAFALVLAACSQDEKSQPGASESQSREDEGRPQRGGDLVFSVEGETDGWDPIANIWSKNAHYVASAVYDPLAVVNKDGDVDPYLAEAIEHNEDYSEWTLTIPDGITFHNGEGLDAEGVRANLEARKAAGLNIFLLKNVGPIEVVDGNKVRITLVDAETGEPFPWVAFDHLFTQQSGYIVPPSLIGTGELERHPIGTGPFVFESWEPDKAFKATRNDDYWGTDENGDPLPYLDSIEFQPITDPAVRAQALESGDIDALLTDDPTSARSLDEKGFETVTDTVGEEAYVFLNTSLPPLDNPIARKALATATDAQSVVDILFEGELDVASSPFHPTERWYDADTGYPEFDLEKAKDLLAQYEEETGQPLSFTLSSTPSEKSVNSLLQQQWAEAGIEVELEELEFAQFTASLIGGDLQAGSISNFGYADPDFMYVFFHPDFVEPGINFPKIDIPVVGEAFDEARQNPDFEARRRAYAEAMRAWNAEHPHVWLYHVLNALVAKPEVNGLTVEESVGFGRVDSKPFIARIWIDSADGD
jgi:peptide/nickel transport system substrate-binding protein